MILERQEKRLAEMVRCGVPSATADAGRKVLEAFGDGVGWSIFAQPHEDPPELLLEHYGTGLCFSVSILPNRE